MMSSPFLWETTQIDPQGLTCRETPIQSIWEDICFENVYMCGYTHDCNTVTAQKEVKL